MLNRIPELEACTSLRALQPLLQDILREAGFDHYIYLTCNADRSAPVLLTNLPGLHDGPQDVFDPFLDHCCYSYDITFTGVEFMDDYAYLTDRDRAFVQRAADMAGFRAGLGIPVRLAGSDRFGGFNLGTGLTRAAFEAKYAPDLDRLRVLALMAHRRIEELASGTAPSADGFRSRTLADPAGTLPDLSPREKEVLYLIAQGYSTKEIARLCLISPNTAAEYRKAAYRKLRVTNATAAVARSYDLGLVQAARRAGSPHSGG